MEVVEVEAEGAVADTEVVVEVTDSVVVMRLADSAGMPLVRDSTGRGDFSLVAEITTALAAGNFAGVIAIFAIVAFAILTGAFSASALPALDIRTTPTTTPIRTTTTMRILTSSLRFNKS
jgi:large-conductance mechanosensitive channel